MRTGKEITEREELEEVDAGAVGIDGKGSGSDDHDEGLIRSFTFAANDQGMSFVLW